MTNQLRGRIDYQHEGARARRRRHQEERQHGLTWLLLATVILLAFTLGVATGALVR